MKKRFSIGILDGIVECVATGVMDGLDLIISSVLGALGTIWISF
ncbi:MAG: hypothetical protein ACK5LT_13975 [Lachnospirales bacterium]